MAFRRSDLPLYLTGAASVAALISIAASEILLGAALAAMIVTRERWKVPPIWLPIVAFLVGSALSLAVNGHYQQGWPEIRKFSIYVLLFLVASTFRTAAQIRWLALAWSVAAAASAAWALNQFYNKYEDAMEAHQDFYQVYVGDRITGFTSHWMTFSEQMMIVLLVMGALLFFSKASEAASTRGWLIGCGALLGVALIAAETRSVWFAAAAGGAYLLWMWKRWTVIAIPVVTAVVLLVNPFEIGNRVISAFKPHGELDSNAHREMCRRIGYEMIKAHPVFGIGPEEVAWQYLNYLPPGTKLPLPKGYYYHLHNIYIHYAAELGIPAMLAMVWMLLRPVYDFSRALRRAPPGSPYRWALHAGIAVAIGTLAGGYFEKNIGDSHVLLMFVAVIGCGYAAVSAMDAGVEKGKL
jgi:O-antigen ligase